MPRLVFEKTGNAIWISHLDLMRLFQRAFKRAGLQLTHTQGFNPRPSVSIALPLSVGVESHCELLDFELDGEEVAYDDIRKRLNEVLVDGVKILAVCKKGRKLGDLALLHCTVTMEYDDGMPQDAAQKIQELFSRESIIVPKRTKNGIQEQDIIPLIRKFQLLEKKDGTLAIDCLICCQNPTLNPMQMITAIELFLPEYAPGFSKCCRMEVYDKEEKVFR